MIDWESVKHEFICDGSLRDIYITPACLEDWAAIWPMLRKHPGAEFFFDSIQQESPETISEVFALRNSGSPLLSLSLSTVIVVFHFFSTEEIEGDFHSREIKSQSELDILLGFVSRLGDLTGKNAIITPENGPEIPFLLYDPTSKNFSCPDTKSINP